ncbi:MAG: DUF305 domain-containing protein [Thermoleophilia bacterium]|nr:DUF305 domain-containing protein [Thermoleophilia bacterium]
MTLRIRPIFTLLILVAVASTGSACGSGSGHGAMGHDETTMTHVADQMGTGQEADVMFVQEMIPHHQQAVEMADLALDPTHQASPAVKDLATRIKTAQAAEIVDMNAWLVEWGADPIDGQMDHGNMDHDAMGMMSSADMTALADAKGAAFDRLWLEGMIMHHEGALTMASHIATRGDDARVQQLSAAIEQSQKAEIVEMRTLLSE